MFDNLDRGNEVEQADDQGTSAKMGQRPLERDVTQSIGLLDERPMGGLSNTA